MSDIASQPENVLYPAIDLPATGRNIERLRTAAGYSVRDLQRLLGLSSAQAIYKWQRGQALPSLDNMVVLSRLLKARIEEILVCKGSAGKESE